jgi:hypothetical protein
MNVFSVCTMTAMMCVTSHNKTRFQDIQQLPTEQKFVPHALVDWFIIRLLNKITELIQHQTK